MTQVYKAPRRKQIAVEVVDSSEWSLRYVWKRRFKLMEDILRKFSSARQLVIHLCPGTFATAKAYAMCSEPWRSTECKIYPMCFNASVLTAVERFARQVLNSTFLNDRNSWSGGSVAEVCDTIEYDKCTEEKDSRMHLLRTLPTETCFSHILPSLMNNFQGTTLYKRVEQLMVSMWSQKCLGQFFDMNVDMLLAVYRFGDSVTLNKSLKMHLLSELRVFASQIFGLENVVGFIMSAWFVNVWVVSSILLMFIDNLSCQWPKTGYMSAKISYCVILNM